MTLKSPYRGIQTCRKRHDALYGSRSYVSKVLSYGPIAYWPLWDTAGATAEELVNSPAQDGTYTGVTLNDATGPDGVNGAPFFDGANDYVSIWTATFDAAFNGAAGSMMAWARPVNAGVWTDGTTDYVMRLCGQNAFDAYALLKPNANDTIRGWLEAGNGSCVLNDTPFSSTDWFHLAATWSDATGADEAKFYVNGIQYGGTCALMNAWAAANLLAGQTLIGAWTNAPQDMWHGWIAHCAVWDTVLTQPQIAELATI